MMAPLEKRPRRSDDYDSAPGGGSNPYYDNVPGTSLTRASAGPSTSTSMQAPHNPAYLSAAAANGAAGSSSAAAANGTLGRAGSPLLASHLSARSLAQASAGHSHHQSSGPEDNEEMAAPPKSSSTSAGTRGRGRGRGRARGSTRGKGRGRGASATAASRPSAAAAAAAANAVDLSHSYSEEGFINGHTLDGVEEDPDEAAPNPLIFQCRSCYRLLGDSFSFVATDTDLGYVILSDVSDVVQQDTAYETSTEPGKDIGSTFARLRCGGCQASVGRNYRTTPRDLDDLRDCFSLEVDAISTYMLGSGFTKQLPGDEEEDGEEKDNRERQAVTLSSGQGLESKMERTRALTIEMSDRLIKAEEDIRRYSALVEQLMQEKAEAQASASAPQPVEEETAPEAVAADESHSTPPRLSIAEPTPAAAEEEMPEKPAEEASVQEPSTPLGDGIKPESQYSSTTTSRPARKATTTYLSSTRSKRSLGGGSSSNGVVVLLDNSNNISYS
ncbi:hypothetical protein NDA14_007090 [Ustilago hordei]|nr:hypothetical protein NDA14_007090 [Ustilago hordei]